VEDLPLTAYVVYHEDIVNNRYVTLCDVLKSVPGFRVSQPQSGELGEAFMQRGMVGNTYTKILINGVDIKPSGTYGMTLGANIPIRQAERIEIIYGPASAEYGNDACVGIVNIVTRYPEKKSFTTADLYCGTGSLYYLDFHAGAKVGHGKNVTMLSIYGSNLNVDNLNVSRDRDLYNRWNYFLQNGEELTMEASDGNKYTINRSMINEEMFNKYYTSLFSRCRIILLITVATSICPKSTTCLKTPRKWARKSSMVVLLFGTICSTAWISPTSDKVRWRMLTTTRAICKANLYAVQPSVRITRLAIWRPTQW
jgi:hypothetical protein